MHNKTVGMGVGGLIVGLLLGYGGAGLLHPATATTTAQNTRGSGNFGSGMMRGGAGGAGGFLTGTVAAEDSGSITLNTRDGSSHVVLVTPNTTVSKSVNGALSDISTGSTIIVSGSTNSDGSTSATLIQLRPTTPTPAQ